MKLRELDLNNDIHIQKLVASFHRLTRSFTTSLTPPRMQPSALCRLKKEANYQKFHCSY